MRMAARHALVLGCALIGVAGAGHAQASIGHRLAYAFGPRAGLTAGREAGYYRCELRVPLDAAVPT